MRLEWIREQLAYNRWANSEVASALGTIENPPEKAVSVFAHVISAECLWYERVSGHKLHYPVWPSWTVDETTQHMIEIGFKWRAYAEETTDALLDLIVKYTNSQAEVFSNKLCDIMAHMMYHGAYHRGQVVLLLRQSGFTPPYTDYIHAIRNHLVVEE